MSKRAITLDQLLSSAQAASDIIKTHTHPISARLKLAENCWESETVSNLIPDTNTWVMSNGNVPDVSGDFRFEATFTSAWEGFSCFFSAELIERVKGKNIMFGLDSLSGASARLELVVDTTWIGGITATESPQFVRASIPETVSSITLRIIIFSADDMHCAFSGVYFYDMAEVSAADSNNEAFFSVRQIMDDNVPVVGVKGTLYFTNRGKMYFTGPNGQVIPLGKSTDWAPYSTGTTAPKDITQLWIDTSTNGGLKYYNGSEWVPVMDYVKAGNAIETAYLLNEINGVT